MIDILSFLVDAVGSLRGREKKKLKAVLSDEDDFARLSSPDIREIAGGRAMRLDFNPDEVRKKADRAYAMWVRFRCGLVELGEAAYPTALAEIDDPPFLLYFRGPLPDPRRLLVAVVGTRRPSEAGRRAAWRTGLECAHLGIGLVSGLACGIDGAAQAACVSQRGYSIAVMANGIDSVHPKVHTGLAANLLETGGCLMSESGPGVHAERFRFPLRNRIISGLSRSVVVVEAPVKSGALITAAYGLEQDRNIWVHADGCTGERGRGCAELAAQGAGILRHMEDVASDDRCIDLRI